VTVKMNGFINSIQTPKERRIKYNFVRLASKDVGLAVRMRDWTVPHIIQALHAIKHKKYNGVDKYE